MDSAKKVDFEKKAVISLLGVFVIVLVVGPLRSMGLIKIPVGASAKAASPVGSVKVTKPLGDMMRDSWDRMDPTKQDSMTSAAPAKAAARYTAQDSRDPMKSLFPVELAHEAATSVKAVPVVEKKPDPPPMLLLNGIVWGGPSPRVLINKKVYGVGDEVQGVKVLMIQRGSIIVDHQGRQFSYTPSSGWPTQVGGPPAPPPQTKR